MTLTERDYQILKFLWVWKLATTAVLRQRFFSDLKCQIFPYKKLRQLQRAGYINQIAFLNGSNFDKYLKLYLWTLSKKGFKEIKEAIGNLKEEGYRSEYPQHDCFVSAIHLGEFLGNLPANVRIFTENQLRRYPVTRYPTWVPREACHRPDGYWCIENGNMKNIYALEVESSVKTISRYSQCASFYRRISEITRVFWFVESVSEAQSVQKALKVYDESRFQIHNFSLLSDFVKSGWRAPIFLGGDRSKTLRSFLTEDAGNQAATSQQLVAHDIWFNPRIARVNPRTSELSGKSDFPNSICIYIPKSPSAPSVGQKSSVPVSITRAAPAPQPEQKNEQIGEM